MADYLYSVAIQANLFPNDMADRTVWRINRGRIHSIETNMIYYIG